MGTAIMVTSGKGGTGKTSVTAGVAGCLAALGRRVLCVDVDIGLRNLDLVLGLSDRAAMDFSDVMARRCSLLNAAVEHPGVRGLYLLTAPLSEEGLDEAAFRTVIGDRAIVVSAVDAAALRDAQRTVSELMGQVGDIHLVMNRVKPSLIRTLRTSLDSAMDTAGLPLLGVIPEDPKVTVAAAEGEPMVLASHKGASPAYLNIAKRLLGQRTPLLRIR